MHRVRGRVAASALSFVLVAVVLRVAVVPPERCPTATTEQRRAAAGEAVAWLDRNQNADGSWLYEYDADADEVSPDYNLVRHAGVILSLYQAAGAGLGAAQPVADRGTGFARNRLVFEDDFAAFGHPGADLETGATALLTAALLERRALTGDRRHDPLLRRLGNFLVGQVRDDGAVLWLWDPATGAPVPDRYDRFATGEALWALARLHRVFPGGGWDEPARRVARYVVTRRDREERQFPYLSDHWTAYALDEMARWPGYRLEQPELDYARRLAGIFGMQVRYESQRRDGGVTELVRGPYAPGSGLGTLGEGLGAVARLAAADARLDDLSPDVAARRECVAGMLVDRQVTGAEAETFPRPELVAGAWFHLDKTRMDDQQHAISALLASPEPVS